MFERILTLSAYAYHALKVLPDVTILTPRPGESGLVSFHLDGHDVKEVVTQLHDLHNIYIRDIPSTGSLRLSTGFYNTEEEIDILAQALRDMGVLKCEVGCTSAKNRLCGRPSPRRRTA